MIEKVKNTETEIDSIFELVEQMEKSEATEGDNIATVRKMTKKHARKHRGLAEPHLRAHKVNDTLYYYYCRGADREIYLGTAETILSWKPGESK